LRADRLLSILLLLQVHGRMTARVLAQRLEVSERTIHRDMEALSAAGVPLIAERGTGGGWELLESYCTNLTGLNEAEIQALFLTRTPHLLADLGLARAAEGARIKLLAALPSSGRRDAEYMRQRIHIDVASWRRDEDAIPHLPALQEAIWQERKLHLTYQRSDDATVERLVDPIGLVAKRSVWYFIAGVDGHLRTYRVSRVRGAHITDQPCIRPEGFDLATYWAQSSAEFKAGMPRYPVLARVAPSLLRRLRMVSGFVRIERIDPPDADGWSRVALLFEVDWEARDYMLRFGAEIEVLEPPELREQVVRTAEAIVGFYRERASEHSGAIAVDVGERV
jgi:predicted DNA-binding transcriptional regulator YafY